MSFAGGSKAHDNNAWYSPNLDHDLTLSGKGHYLALNSERSSVIGNPFLVICSSANVHVSQKPNVLSLFIASLLEYSNTDCDPN